MTFLAIVSGAERGDHAPRSPGRVRGLLGRLQHRTDLDLVLVHTDGSAPADRRRRRLETLPPDGVRRLLEIAVPPLRRSGRLREVHIPRSDLAASADRGGTASLQLESFLASSPDRHDLIWCADLGALTRATRVRPATAAAVDIDRAEDLGRARARRAARTWCAAAYLVTTVDADVRERLGVPGAAVVADPDDPWFDAAITGVLDEVRAYRPVRAP